MIEIKLNGTTPFHANSVDETYAKGGDGSPLHQLRIEATADKDDLSSTKAKFENLTSLTVPTPDGDEVVYSIPESDKVYIDCYRRIDSNSDTISVTISLD